MDKVTQKQIEVGVEWWANALRGPEFQADKPGNATLVGLLAENMASSARKAKIYTEEQIKKFGEKLTELLNRDYHGNLPQLTVEYEPRYELWTALEAAGIRPSNSVLPWKTTMTFMDGGVQIRSIGSKPKELLLTQ